MSPRARVTLPPLLRFLAFLALAPLLGADGRTQPVISEFLASNSGSLLDEDGEASDWIELHNPTSTPLSLSGWFLTDDPSAPAKWALPDRALSPGGFLVVFASGKNRSPAEPAPLHTNFRLEAAGEYLALVHPGTGSVSTEFQPVFLPQEPDISFGTPTSPGSRSLLSNASLELLIPSAPSDLRADWLFGVGQPPASRPAPLGFPVGFDTTPANPNAATNLALSGTASQSTTGFGLPAENGNDGDLSTYTHTATQDDASSWTLDLGAAFEIRQLVLHNRPECCQSRFRDLTVQLLDTDGATVLWTSGLLNPENHLDSPASLRLDLLDLGVEPVAARFVRVSRTPDPDLSGSGGVGNADEDSVLTLAEVEVYGVESLSFAPLLRTDLTDSVLRRNSSVLARVPFVVDAPAAMQSLTLTLRYDDGVAVFLNGRPLVARNAPTSLPWNASALEERSKSASLLPEAFDLLPFTNLLRAGTNWLGFHALNASADDPDFLLDATLTTENTEALFAAYLDQPTPGASNNVSWNLGRVADTRFSVTRGFLDAPFDLAIVSDTPDAEIRYTLDGSAPSAEHGQIYATPLRIAQTTVVRAAAFKPNHRPTNIDSHTYLLVEATVAQPSRPDGFPASWAGLSADYAMDPRITESAIYGPQVADSLKSLPTLSLATDVDNLFGASRGIYANPERSGLSWERPVSLEWIEPGGSGRFQADAGIRIQGGYFRSRNATRKHSLRLLFKNQYGPGRLRTDLFEVFGAAREFDTLVLRAGANDGYAWDAARDTEQFLRDEFGRRLHLAMGQTSPHGRFVHLYLNGLYWGLYNLTERPAEDFSATYFGGQPEDWDAVNSGEVKNGSLSDWNTFLSQVRSATTLADYQRLKGARADGTPDPTLPAYLDAPNYIDYMLLNIWGGNWDWPNKNFWFGRNRTGDSGGFKFYLWDFENTMGNNRDRSPLEMVSPRSGITGAWVAEPHDRLQRLDEYRIEFADRVHRHCFHNGPLSPASLVAHYRQLAEALEPAIVAETARWGDDHHSPPQDLSDWRRERDWLLTSYLPRRTEVVLNQFRASGLYPQTIAPSFMPPGGSVSPSTPVSFHTRAASELFYTTNGLDPRLPGGAVRPGAVRIPLAATDPAASPNLVRPGHVWRYLADGSNPGDAWRQPSFDDAAWPSGPSPLGYGDGDEATAVPFVDATPTQAGIQKNPTTYFRTTFTVDDPTDFTHLRLTLTYDDAAAVYLNGTRILLTDNLDPSARFDTYATSASADNAVASLDPVDRQLLRPGINVLAAEVHQSDGGSSDISFNLDLIGVVAGEADLQVSGPLFFSGPTRLMARARRNGEWSALHESLYLPGAVPAAAGQLVVSQFCFRPADPTVAAETSVSTDRDDFEYVELLNIGTAPLDLTGVQLTGGIAYTFPAGRFLDPGQRILLVRSQPAFRARYGGGPTIEGEFEGRLANDSDSILLRDATGGTILAFTYSDRSPWPESANEGFALVLLQPSLNPDPNQPLHWRSSVLPGGTPGQSDASRFVGTPDADANANGQADLLDYAFGGSLLAPGRGIEVGLEQVVTNAGTQRHLTVSHPRNLAADDAPIVLETAAQVSGPWRPATEQLVLTREDRLNAGIVRLTYRLLAPLSPQSHAFLRLTVEARTSESGSAVGP